MKNQFKSLNSIIEKIKRGGIMKRNFNMLIAVAVLVFCGFSPVLSKAQDVEGIDYNRSSILGAGLSVGYYSYGFMGSRSLSIPPLGAYYEFGVHEKITVGPFAGLARWNYSYTGFGSEFNYSWTFFQIGGRGSYHMVALLNDWFDAEMDESKIDIYLSLLLGLEFRSYNVSSSFDGNDQFSSDMHLFIGPIAGFRYYLNPSIALFLEGGRGSFGALTFGVSSKF
jgi:hypothetical protein